MKGFFPRKILRKNSDLEYYNKADQVNYTVKMAWRAIHFTMRILKKGNSNTNISSYMSLVGPILEYGSRTGICIGRDKKYLRKVAK